MNINNIIRDILFSKGYVDEDGSPLVEWIVKNGEIYIIYDYRIEEEIDDLALKEYKEMEYKLKESECHTFI